MTLLSTLKCGVGVTLALAIALNPVLAQAQMVPAQDRAQPTAPQPRPSTDRQPQVAVTYSQLTGGYRAPQTGDNDMAVIGLDEFVASAARRGIARPDAERMFGQIREQNKNSCTETGEWVREAIGIANEAQIIDAQLVGFYRSLDNLGRAQRRSQGVAIGTQVVSTGLLCAVSFGLYCAAAGAGAVGNIGNIRANGRANAVDRNMRFVNVDQSRVQIRATLLNMRATIGWAQRFQGWCMIVYPNETSGADGTQMTPNWGYPTGPVALYSSGRGGADIAQPAPAQTDGSPANLLPEGFFDRNRAPR